MEIITFQRMTVAQVNKACQKHPYILFRFPSGKKFAVNSKIAPIRIKKYNQNDKTDFVSFQPCDFMTYITYKTPFI